MLHYNCEVLAEVRYLSNLRNKKLIQHVHLEKKSAIPVDMRNEKKYFAQFHFTYSLVCLCLNFMSMLSSNCLKAKVRSIKFGSSIQVLMRL